VNDVTSDMVRFRFPALRRLKLSREFERMRKEGQAVRGGLLMLSVLPVDSEMRFRVGLITSRRVGGAVVRNQVRRRLREVVRRNQHALKSGMWFVVIARRSAAQADFAALEGEWLRLAKRAKLMRDSESR
jgi:ribonuclease P protein component